VAKVEKKRALSEDRLRDFLREMLLIRRFEEKVEERFRAGELPHGYGGSMHLYDVERGNLGANAVVGGGLPSLVGAGLAFKMRDEPRVAVAFFGDGATNTGTFHESLNLAQLWKTKTMFVCENNSWAESTPGWQHSPVWEDMSKRALAFDMHSIKVNGQDVEEVYEKASEALEHVRAGRGPVFLDVETYRMHGHYIGDPQVYRSQEDRDRATAHDPIALLREKLHVSDEEWDALEAEVTGIVESAVEFAKAGTDPQPEDALKNIYA
jgi:pyruvate dehydrogenase E1 component alpha subunit